MIVENVMTKNPVFVNPDTSVTEVKELMDKNNIGKIPVLDKHNKLVGIVTKKDLVTAGPSVATTLDVYEVGYLLSKLKVSKIMEKKVVTVQESEVVEEAAKIMADKGISCLPVMKDSLLVGIITQKDLFNVFVEMFGTRTDGVRIMCSMNEKPGQIASVTSEIAEKGGNIISLITCDGMDKTMRRCTYKICGLSVDQVKEIFTKQDIEIEDIR